MKTGASIIDGTLPNAGRIYDFFLKGNHNFEVDRQVAEEIVKKAPFIPHMALLLRWFLKEASLNLVRRGFKYFLDFASGLPTQDHIHGIIPEDGHVLYTDNDQITVKFGRDLIKNIPNADYEYCNAVYPDIILNSPLLDSYTKECCQIAIGFNGIAYFLPNDSLRYALRTLYQWAPRKTVLFITDVDCDQLTDELKDIIDIYTKLEPGGEVRSQNVLKDIVSPWVVEEPGFLPLERWLNLGNEVNQEAIKAWGGGGIYGGYLYKP